jgi:2-(1,2-epoxy-1,2-dihydrophenyl)acetyl-CoA isomerase
MNYGTLTCTVDAGLCRITLDRPDRMNGITNQMLRELRGALSAAATNEAIRVLVLSGSGKAFCVGADLNHFMSGAQEEPVTPEDFVVASLLHEMPAVTVAAINGACAGAGLGWALACDLRFVAASARLNTAFLDVALAGDMAIPWSLPRLIGAGRARDWSFRPRRIASDEAVSLGLAAEAFPDEDFRSCVDRAVAPLLAKAPGALKALKANYLAAERMALTDFVQLEATRHVAMMDSAETSEAFAAFMEKREPRFT